MKKRTLFLVLLLVLLLVPCVIASAAGYYYVSGTTWLKLRQLPDVNSRALASYPTDYAIVSYHKYDDNWAYVFMSDGHEGYVQSKYVKSSSSFAGYITTDNTILRSGPEVTYSALARMAKGTRLNVLSAGKSWYYVSSVHGSGYVNKNYISKKYIKPTVKIKTPYYAYVVNPLNRPVNVRAGAGTQFDILTTLDPGTKVQVTAYGNSWCYITCSSPSVEGYMMNRYLKPAKALQTVGPSAAPTFEPTPTPAPFDRYVAYVISKDGSKVPYRRGPGAGYASIASLKYGTSVIVVEHTNKNWARITLDEKTYGYIKRENLTTEQPEIATYKAWVKAVEGTTVNVRTGCGTGFAVAYRLLAFTEVTVIDDCGVENWSHIKYAGVYGYIQSKYLTTYEPEFTPQPTDDPRLPTSQFPYYAWIVSPNPSPVIVRRGPGKGYALAGAFYTGDKVTVIGQAGNWFHVKKSKIEGYVHKDYLTTTKVTPVPSPTKTPKIEDLEANATILSSDGEPVYMRKGPGKGYGAVKKLKNRTRVTILVVGKKWTYIYHGGDYGYVMNEFLLPD